MKTTLLALFFLAFASSTALGRTIDAIVVEPVFDTDGNPVTDAGLYLILPATEGNGGGFVSAAIGDETCPISVVQNPSNGSLGMSLFFRLNSKLPVVKDIYPTDFVDIIFAGRPLCATSAKWIVKIFSPVPAVFIGEEDESTVSGGFHIQKYEDAYKLVFCPDRIPGTCWDLGISSFGNRRLVTNQENPFKFVIRSLNPKTSASII